MKESPKKGPNKPPGGKYNKYQPWNKSAQNRDYNTYGTWNDRNYDDGYYRNYDIFSGQPLTRAQKIAMDQCYRTMEQEQKQRESQAKEFQECMRD